MKRFLSVLLLLALCLGLCGCGAGSQTDEWQTAYDLGVKYLAEGNYEEAVLQFTAAIQIDPKRAPAYAGLAQAYTGAGDADAALAALQQGVTETGDADLQQQLTQLEEQQNTFVVPAVGPAVDPLPVVRTEEKEYSSSKHIYEYDKNDNVVRHIEYRKGVLDAEMTYLYDANGMLVSMHCTNYDSNGELYMTQYHEFDGLGRKTKIQDDYLYYFEGPYGSTETFAYNGAEVSMTVYAYHYDGSTYNWAGVYTMTDPAHSVRITPWTYGENGAFGYVGVREQDYDGTNEEVAHAAYDGAGNSIPWQEF